jgi:hypothetical protein
MPAPQMHWAQLQAIRDRNVLLRAEDYAGVPTDTWRGRSFSRMGI